jgi:ubiquinone/menaquinone biosynthesis C-methylase UbiE
MTERSQLQAIPASPALGDAVAGIPEFYAGSQEITWKRHDTFARLEGGVLDRLIEREFPSPPARVADVGGGNGRSAYKLADRGYSVWLSDLTPALVADAETRGTGRTGLADIQCADARALPYQENFFDACLCLGPLYGVRDGADRIAVLRELDRVLRPGGVALLQYFNRVSGLRSLLTYEPVTAGVFSWRSFLETGIFTDSHIPDLFRLHAWLTEEEVITEIGRSGLVLDYIQGMDGPAPGSGQDNLCEAPDSIVAQWIDIAMEVGSTRGRRETCDHLLAVVSKAA